MKLSNNPQDILALFRDCHIVINESPLLGHCDIGGSNDEEIYLSWVDEENGGSYTIPFDNLNDAQIRDGCLLINDDYGDECTVTFYQIQQVMETSKTYTITWSNEYDLNALYEFTVPADVDLFQGYLEHYDPILEGKPCIESRILDELGITFEPDKGESLLLAIGEAQKKSFPASFFA